MEKEDKTNIQKVTELLHKLAILKNQVRTPEQLIAMATYLEKHFSYPDLVKASEYFLQRSPYMPSIDSFFSVLKPIKTLEQRALDLKFELDTTIKDSVSYIAFLGHATAKPELLKFVKQVGWNKSQSITDREAVEIFKGILNNKEFYLGGTSENAQIEQS